MEQGHPCVTAFSSGKDSSVVANLVLSTAAARVRAGLSVPPILVIHSDTGVENPEVRRLADGELDKMRAYAQQHGLALMVRVGKPLLYSSWAVRVLSGRALPAFANANADCAVDFKVLTGRRLTAAAFAELLQPGITGITQAVQAAQTLQSPRATPMEPSAQLQALMDLSEQMQQLELDFDAPAPAAASDEPRLQREPVVMTGVRLGESTARTAAIRERGETDDMIWQDEEGRSYMSPILAWSADEVFEYLGYANAGLIEAYSKFDETLQFYRDAGGSACAVVGAMQLDENVARQKGGCGARSGCWTCVKVANDTSLQQMIVSDPDRYGYMAGLGDLRNFIARTQYDWSRRTYLGRTIDAQGYVAIQPDRYSPRMLEDLLHYTLSLQAVEMQQARSRRAPPRFSVIGPREIVAIDAMWSLYGLHRPYHALHILRRVESGDLAFPPTVPDYVRTPPKRIGKLYVGTQWDSELVTGNARLDAMRSGGIRNPVLEMFAESCGAGVRRTADGTLVTEYATADSFEVDEEAAADFMGCGMMDEQIDRYHDDPRARCTTAVMWYLQMGIVQPASASLSRWHRIAKRTDWIERHGLAGQPEPAVLAQMVREQPFLAQEQKEEQALEAAGPQRERPRCG